jgi:hypothetical protein
MILRRINLFLILRFGFFFEWWCVVIYGGAWCMEVGGGAWW